MDDFLPASELNRTQRRISAAATKSKGGRKVVSITNDRLNCPDNWISVDLSLEELNKRVENAVSQLRDSDYFGKFSKILNEASQESGLSFDEIICYGLGTFGNSVTARYQLAFLILLQLKLQTKVEIFDPTFTTNEKKLLKTHLGFDVLLENEEAHRRVTMSSTGTLFYMPHAPHQLVNNLLYTNWCPSGLSKIICICNSFGNLKANVPPTILRKQLEYIGRTAEVVVEYDIDNCFTYKDIFNDLAVHAFPARLVKELNEPNEFWKTSVKPTYEQLEFIPAVVTDMNDLALSSLKIS